MQSMIEDLNNIMQDLSNSTGYAQLLVIALGFAMAWGIATVIRRRVPSHLEAGSKKFGAGSIHRLTLPLLALLFIWLGKLVLQHYQATPLLKLVSMLIASFVVIRFLLYLLRHVMPPSSALKAFERLIAYGVWLLVALYLTGLLPEIGQALDDIYFLVGKQKISLLLILHALLSVTLVLFITLSVSGVIEKHLREASNLDRSTRTFAAKLLRVSAVLLAILIALPLIGIDITVLSVFGGALGVGLGLGMQKIASNYVSGFVILIDRSIRPGDFVSIDNRHGIIADIKARYTVLRSADGSEAIIPNDSIITNTVINHTYSDTAAAIKMPVTVALSSDAAHVLALLLSSATTHQRVLQKPAPVAIVKNILPTGIELELVVWINDSEQGQNNLRSDILLDILRLFREHGVELASANTTLKMETV